MNTISTTAFINSNKIIFSHISDNTTYLHTTALYVDKNAFNLILVKTKIDIIYEDKRGCTPLFKIKGPQNMK